MWLARTTAMIFRAKKAMVCGVPIPLLAVVPASHALSSATTPIIYKECHGQGNAAFRTVGERVVAAYSATPIIYKEYHGQDNAAFRAVGESVVAACADTPIIYIGSQMQG